MAFSSFNLLLVFFFFFFFFSFSYVELESLEFNTFLEYFPFA